MIRLNVFIEVNSEMHDEVLKLAKELVKESLNDTGCVAYDIFESATRQNVFMICETWKDSASLSTHEATKHFTTLVPEIHKRAKMKLEKFEF